ncbi:MAG: YiiD C-terminal domain-containing protein [Nitrospirae bacterium]|nr:YiiD C-terminal domain-containing protein [Nitrospirota bacterium]
MTKDSLKAIQDYLHEHIPLSKAMGVEVRKADAEGVVLSAPLAPNINHRETVFGGSASSLAILAAWTAVHFRLKQEGLTCRLVIQRNSMSYDKPIAGDFTARCDAPETEAWQHFVAMLKRKKIARVELSSVIEYDQQIAGRMEGAFVAIRTD